MDLTHVSHTLQPPLDKEYTLKLDVQTYTLTLNYNILIFHLM